MRVKTFLSLLIAGIAAVILVPAITMGQPGGFGKKKGNFGGGGGGLGRDPGAIFDQITGGKPYIEISTSRMREKLSQFAQQNGITNGQINRDQWIQYMQQAQSRLTSPAGNTAPAGPGGGTPNRGGFGGGQPGGFGGGQPGGFGGGQPGGFRGQPGGFGGGFGGQPGGFGGGFGGNKGGGQRGGMDGAAVLDQDVVNQWADNSFKRADRNGDGKLNKEEMSPTLLSNLVKFDRNNDNLVDRDEFREYTMSMARGELDSRGGGIASIIIEEEELDRKPVVYRAGGKMPPGLPSWFKELDTDADGQIAMWEWRRGGKDLADFSSWDLNEDGVIAPEEAVRQQTAIAKSNPRGSTGSGSFEEGDEQRSGFGGFGPGSAFGKSKGQRPSFGNGEGGNPFGQGQFGQGFGKGNKGNKGNKKSKKGGG